MGLSSDSETESMAMKSKIDEINIQAIVSKEENTIKQIENTNENCLETNNSFLHKCTFDGCDKSFEKPSRLTWHLRQHSGERPYKCNFENCDKCYTNPSHLKRHQKSHETVHEAVVCGVCQLTLKNRFNLLKHHRRAHENKNRLSCEICSIPFRKKYKYDEHMTRFHQGKLFKCKKCDGEFKNLLKLRRHETIHDKKYKCPEDNCDMEFETHIELRAHAKVHPKEHICEKCKKKFANTHQLNRHLKTHEGKLLACPYDDCHKSYYHLNHLNFHIKTKHEKKRLFECDLCKNTFFYKQVLCKHIQSIHSNIKLYKPRVYKKGEERKIRHDSGKQIRSMPSVLTGLLLPHQVEKVIINRDSSIKLSDTNFEFIQPEQI